MDPESLESDHSSAAPETYPLAEQGGHLLGLLVHQGCRREHNRNQHQSTPSRDGGLHWGTAHLWVPSRTPGLRRGRQGKRHRTIRHQEQGHSKAAPAAQRVLAHGPRGGRQPPTSRPNSAHRGRAACRRGSAPASWCRAPRGRAPGPGTAPSPAEVCAREGDASARRTGAVDAAALAERALHVASAMRPRLHQTTCNIRVHQNGDAAMPPPNHLQHPPNHLQPRNPQKAPGTNQRPP